jgi:predicted aldo/keto reductase-like oxidoreductase
MEKIRLGRTNLMVSRTSFGALPIQRISFEAAKYLLRKAYNNGINYFDTARMYSDSEEKIGYALSDVRENIIISTKSHAKSGEELLEHLETSLKNLKTDYVDILQLHNPPFLPVEGHESGLYEAALKAKRMGKARYIGITNHQLKLTKDAVTSGLYDTVQFPLCSISSQKDLELIPLCKDHDIGLIAMKGLSGGLITNASSTFTFLRQYENLVPIWGIQREWELDEFISLEANPPKLDTEMLEIIEKDRRELAGSFCRSCGYCMPCPVGIPIPTAARISYLLDRSSYEPFMTDEWRKKMDLVNDCIECGQCKSRCPYGLDTPNLLKKMLESYNNFYTNYHKKKS